VKKAAAILFCLAMTGIGYCQEERFSVTGSAELLRTMPIEGWDPVSLRQFDGRTDGLRLVNARLVFRYSDTKGKFMAHLEPWIGDARDVLADYEPSENDIARSFGQAYLRFGDDSANIEVGKFNSWIGYESPLAAENDHFSRGALYTLAQPAYHAGLRASKQFTPGFGASLFLVTGWSQVEGDGAFGGQARWQLDPKTAATVGLYSGQEGSDRRNYVGSYGGIGFASSGSTRVNLVDVIVTHDVDPSLRLALNADIASASGSLDGGWSGLALYAKKSLGLQNALTLRFGWVKDSDGLRTGSPAEIRELTMTWSHQLNSGLSLMLEARHDWATMNLFSVDGDLRNSQTTIGAGLVFRF